MAKSLVSCPCPDKLHFPALPLMLLHNGSYTVVFSQQHAVSLDQFVSCPPEVTSKQLAPSLSVGD
jgi:hypothetical protein